jgi:hypothetical protein
MNYTRIQEVIKTKTEKGEEVSQEDEALLSQIKQILDYIAEIN